MDGESPRWSSAEQAERDHLAYLCDVAACLATVAWPEPVVQVQPSLVVELDRRLALVRARLKGAA